MRTFYFIAKLNAINEDYTSKSGKLIKSHDTKGAQNGQLKIVAGTAPNRFHINGTIIGSTSDMETGKTMLLQCDEVESGNPEFPHNYQYTVLDCPKGSDLVKSIKDLGQANIVNVDEVVEQEETVTQTEASEAKA